MAVELNRQRIRRAILQGDNGVVGHVTDQILNHKVIQVDRGLVSDDDAIKEAQFIHYKLIGRHKDTVQPATFGTKPVEIALGTPRALEVLSEEEISTFATLIRQAVGAESSKAYTTPIESEDHIIIYTPYGLLVRKGSVTINAGVHEFSGLPIAGVSYEDRSYGSGVRVAFYNERETPSSLTPVVEVKEHPYSLWEKMDIVPEKESVLIGNQTFGAILQEMESGLNLAIRHNPTTD